MDKELLMFSVDFKRWKKNIEGESNEGRTIIQQILSSYNAMSIELSTRERLVYRQTASLLRDLGF